MTTTVHESELLPPLADSVREARQFVRDTLSRHMPGLPTELGETAALLVSELGANAVLHARTPFNVSVELLDGRVRIGVRDDSTTAPVVRHYPVEAATGRGLRIVRDLSHRTGTSPEAGGKVVWFELEVAPEQADRHDELLLHQVRLVGFPLGVYAEAQQHADGLVREMRLIADPSPQGEAQPPARLVALVEELVVEYTGRNSAPEAARDEALARGDATIDLVFTVPSAASAACRRLGQQLDQVDQWCRDGRELLTLVTPPAALQFRRWYLGEFIRQIAGQDPQPWRAHDWPWPVPFLPPA